MPGGKGYNSPIGIEKCGAVYWAFFGFQFILAGIWTLIIALMYKNESKIRKEGNHIFHPKEIKYSETPIWKFSIGGVGAGFIIGAAGAGGGMLLVPIVVEMGVNSRSATAMAGF